MDQACTVLQAMRPSILRESVPDYANLQDAAGWSVLFHLDHAERSARVVWSDEGFTVLAGSVIRPGITKSCPASARSKRKEHAAFIQNNVLTRDLVFRSPPGATSFILGRASNGREILQTSDGTPYWAVEEQSRPKRSPAAGGIIQRILEAAGCSEPE